MFKQVGIGAASVLALGLLAAGCSEDGDTIIAGGGNLLQNTDSTPFSGLTNNNLANDGGGFTPNGSNLSAWQVKFNCDSPKSDGTFSGDNSAVVLFTTANNRVYASHFLSGEFTPPVELEASDRDYAQPVTLTSYVMVPLNTSTYQSTNSTPGANVNTVRQNSGNWVIIGEYLTKFVTPGQDVDTTSTFGKGARRIIGSWTFVKSLRGQSKSASNAVGGLTQEFRYGFQRFADEIPTAHQRGEITGFGATPTKTAPANHVLSYGVVTDGLAGQASFGGVGTPYTGASSAAVGQAHFTIGGAQVGINPSFDEAAYTVGENVSHLVCVFTQIETSTSSDNNRFQVGNLTQATTNGGQSSIRYRVFNLATQTWGTEARISTGIRPAPEFGMGEGVGPDFMVYNNTLLYRYVDISLDTQATGFAPNSVDLANIQFARGGRTLIAAARFADDNNGSAALSGNAIDVSTDVNCVTGSANGTPGTHTRAQFSRTTAVGPANPDPSVEISSYIGVNGSNVWDGSDQNRSIYGSDEGLEETTLFYRLTDNTASGSGLTGSGPNADAELAAVVIRSGALSTTSFATGTNPVRISGTTHATDNEQNTSPSSVANGNDETLADPVTDAKFALNRPGRAIAIAFRRKLGVNHQQNNAVELYLNVYRPFRLEASTTSSTLGGTAANVESRFLAAPVVVDSTTVSHTNASGITAGLDVNTYGFQGGLCYRGRQSNANVFNLFWEQSDTTGDRVFGARVEVNLGTTNNPAPVPALVSSANLAKEFTFATKVQGPAAFISVTTGAAGTSSFDWLNGSAAVDNDSNFQSVDSGSDLGSSTATNGNVLLVFRRVDDATSTDTGTKNEGDVGFYATTFDGNGFATPAKIGTTAHTNETIGTVTTAFNFTTVLTIATQGNLVIDDLVAVNPNSDITNKANYPTNSDTGYFVALFKDREATLTAASTPTTTTVVGGNSSSRRAQFARRISFVNSTATPAVSAIADRIFPSVNNTTTSPFALPIQLDHAQGVTTDAGRIQAFVNGAEVGVVFEFDAQLWYQATQDGENWLRDSSTGLPNPGLISNFSSADIEGSPAWEVDGCQDGTGNIGTVLVFFAKKDTGANTTRGFVADYTR